MVATSTHTQPAPWAARLVHDLVASGVSGLTRDDLLRLASATLYWASRDFRHLRGVRTLGSWTRRYADGEVLQNGPCSDFPPLATPALRLRTPIGLGSARAYFVIPQERRYGCRDEYGLARLETAFEWREGDGRQTRIPCGVKLSYLELGAFMNDMVAYGLLPVRVLRLLYLSVFRAAYAAALTRAVIRPEIPEQLLDIGVAMGHYLRTHQVVP